jgi:hypothetical protein
MALCALRQEKKCRAAEKSFPFDFDGVIATSPWRFIVCIASTHASSFASLIEHRQRGGDVPAHHFLWKSFFPRLPFPGRNFKNSIDGMTKIVVAFLGDSSI